MVNPDSEYYTPRTSFGGAGGTRPGKDESLGLKKSAETLFENDQVFD